MSESLEEVVVSSSPEKAVWQDKYARLLEQFTRLQKSNQDLEDKLLNVVEKTERDKILLSEEIDELSRRLTAASNHATKLENECARYKSDCVLAVHLLQCQPSSYVAQKLSALPNEVREMAVPNSTPFKDDPSLQSPLVEQSSKKLINVSSHATFPPTAIFYNPEEFQPPPPQPLAQSPPKFSAGQQLEEQPEDPIIPKSGDSSQMKGESESLQKVFVDKIRAEPDYSCVELKQCKQCGSSLAMIDKWTQTMTIRSGGVLGHHSASTSALSRVSESEKSTELIRLDSGSEVDDDISELVSHAAEVHLALNLGHLRIRSTDSDMSTDTPI